jgi:hypothetical protein
MPSRAANPVNPCILRVAGVRFVLPDAPPAVTAWPEPFHDFLAGDAGGTDLACEVRCLGADASLAAEAPQPDAPWQFRTCDGGCELTRRSSDGVAIWRVRAPLGFEEAVLSWHPQRFHAVYGDYQHAWTTGLGLSMLVFRLREHGGLVLHGSAMRLQGDGILCAGVSGAGKSTIARLLHSAGAEPLTDERPVVRLTHPAGFHVHGSPWPSAAGFARNAGAPLRRLYFLEHGPEDRLTPLAPREALQRLVHVTTIPWHDPVFFDPCLATIEALLQSVPCAVLSFRPTKEVVDVIRKDLQAGCRRP